MNILKKKLIKNDFFKAIEGHPNDWNNVSLYHFEREIYKLNKKIKDELTLCLSHIVEEEIYLKPWLSDKQGLAFRIDDVYNALYMLSDGKIKSTWKAPNKQFMDKAKNLGTELDILYKAYIELMKIYGTEIIPLTERVSFYYNFNSDYWFELKDKKDDNKVIVICEYTSGGSCVDTDDQCYFSWNELAGLVVKIRINPYYDSKLKRINEDVTLRIEELKKELGITETKKNDDDISEYTPSNVQDEVLGDRFIIREENLFVEVDGVKCVREEWKKLLRYLDLANISFEGVNIAGLDFSGSNAVINPELVYNKDINMCTFDDNNLVSDPDISTECDRSRKR